MVNRYIIIIDNMLTSEYLIKEMTAIMNMDEILSQLVKVDNRAVEMVDTASESLELTTTNIDREIIRYKEKYFQEMQERIGLEKTQMDEQNIHRTEDIDKRYSALRENLELVYTEKCDEWVGLLTKRCTNK